MPQVQSLLSLRSLGHRRAPSTTAPPGAPTGLTLGSATGTTQALSWTAPATGGGAPVSYSLQVRTSVGPGAWQPGGASTGTNAVVTGLTAATSYDYRLFAVNAAGSGPASSAVTGSTAAAGYSPTLDFSDSRNGQYAIVLAA